MLLFKAVEKGSIFIKSSSKLIALTAVSVYLGDVKGKNPILLYLKIKVPTMKFQLTLVKSLLAAAGVAAVSAVSAAPAWAFNFGNIAGGDTSGDSYENSFTWDLVNQGSSVFFNASNSGNVADPSMFIRELFFDDKGYLSAPLVNIGNVGQVAFIVGASNDRLPQEDNGSTTDHDFWGNTGGNVFGIQSGEILGLRFTGDYNLVISALKDGPLKLGLHVQALPNGQSDSYISSSGNTQDTPEPLTMLAAGGAVGSGTMFQKQRERTQKARSAIIWTGFRSRPYCPTDYFMRDIKTWFQPETRFFILLFKAAVEEDSIFIKSSSNLLALSFVSVYFEDVKEKNPILLYLKIKVPKMKSPLTLAKSLLAVAGVAAVSAVSAAPASAFSFGNIPGGDTLGDDYVNSFTYTVTRQGSAVRFDIFNSGNVAAAPNMFISKVFFDDNGYLSAPSLYGTNVGEVSFSGGPSNDPLPQGGNNFTTDYAFSRNPGSGNVGGIQGAESFPVSFRGNYNNVIAALNSGALRVGLHVQGLPNGQSVSYISSNTQDTPEPLTMLAAGAAVGFGTVFKKQRAQAQKAR
jgi:hypothetical protein